MRRTALILAAHGSRHEPTVNALVCEWAALLCSFRPAGTQATTCCAAFDEVVAAFHQGTPTFAQVLDDLSAERVVVVPVMSSEGYYCNEFLPAELAKNRRYAEVELTITKPVGLHPDMVGLVETRALELADEFAVRAGTSSLAVVGHGTKRNPQSRVATERLVDALRLRGQFAEVHAFFLDEPPGVEEIRLRMSCREILVVPFLISGGPHATRDIPVRFGAAVDPEQGPPFAVDVMGRPILCDTAIGTDARMLKIISSLASEALSTELHDANHSCAPPKLTTRSIPRRDHVAMVLGTRGSRLARWQAQHVARLLHGLGAAVEILELSTLGDRVLDRAIRDLPSDAPFTGDIEEVLLSGEIDLAVHSLKDLPVAKTPGLAIAAVLPRGSVTESLVSHDGLTLSQLQPGATVGTSSPRRVAQLLAVRPDLVALPIRGAVDDRVRQVRGGAFDAAILATAGLERLSMLDAAAEELSLDAFLPAPAQGAMVVQCRSDDTRMIDFCRAVDDSATRSAVTAELEFLRPFEHSETFVAAALAKCEGARITLRARLLSLDGRFRRDVVVSGVHPIEAAQAALARFDEIIETHPEPQR